MDNLIIRKYHRLKISLTDGCNLNCKHCYLGTKVVIHANLAVVLQRIAEAGQLGVQILDLTGGEPTIHPEFCTILDVAGKSGFGRINLSTNGMSLARNDILSRLEYYKVHCNISLDGVTESTVNTIRGQNIFKRLEKVFVVLKERGIPFSLRFSVNNLNMNEVGEMICYARRWGVNADIEPTQLIGNASESVLLNSTQIMTVKRMIESLRQDPSITIDESFTKSCSCDGGFSDLLSLNVHGTGVSCLMITHGNQPREAANELSLAKMWEQLQDEKERMRNFRPEFLQCNFCQYRSLCASGCWVTAYSFGCFVPSEKERG